MAWQGYQGRRGGTRFHGTANPAILLSGMADSTSPETAPEAAVAAAPVVVDPAVVATLADGTKVKVRKLRMRACNEKDAKNNICAGHLKRWYFFGEEVKAKYGEKAEIYRCEHCKTLYLPNPDEQPRTETLAW